MRLPGIWAHGALTIALLATAGFFYAQKEVVIFAIMSGGFAYSAEFLAQEMEYGRSWGGLASSLQTSMVLASVGSGLLAFGNLVL